jgi:hypothetical protein
MIKQLASLGLLSLLVACAAEARITSFEECMAAGHPVMESFPRQCRTPDGQTFTEDVQEQMQKDDLIRVSTPRAYAEVSSPITITGEARGTWYFEATFPLVLEDSEGNVIAESFATAEEEWMTEEFVPFTGEITADLTGFTEGTLVLQKSNASGLAENDDELRIPVMFVASEIEE